MTGKAAATATAYTWKVRPTLTALAQNVHITSTISGNEASQAIASYASSVLGILVKVSKAGGLTADVSKQLAQTSASVDRQNEAVKLAATSFGAILSNGAASLSYGTGAISGDVDVDVQGASLGVYSVVLTSSTPLDVDSAFSLALKTFPALATFDYTPYAINQGFAWYAQDVVSAIDPGSLTINTMTEAVLVSVLVSSGGKTVTVTATVGRGDLASLITNPTKAS